MKKIVVILSVSALMSLFGCSETADKTETADTQAKNTTEQPEVAAQTNGVPVSLSVPAPESFLYNGQAFEIVYYYQNYLDYLSKAEEQPEKLDELFMETVLNPLGGGDGQWIRQQYGFSAPTRPALLTQYLSSLIENQETIHQLIQEALQESADRLQPGVSKYVYVLPANPDDAYALKQMKGVAANTWNENTITLQIAPPVLEEEHVKFTVAHEYHHTVFMENTELAKDDSLLDNVLLEGKADTFARLLYPAIQTPWSEFASEQNEADTWAVLQKSADSSDPLLKQLFFHGDSAKGLPKWANYKMGNKIMERFISENPDVSIAEWTDLPSDEILQRSKYVPPNK